MTAPNFCKTPRVLSGALLVVLIAQTVVVACSCAWSGPFLSVASSADVIVYGTVLRYGNESRGVKLSMDVQVREVLKGQESRKTIRVWGDNGAQCRPYVSSFPVGTEWIWAMQHLPPDTKGPHGESPNDYTIWVCGGNWLQVQGNQVSGHVSSKMVTDPEQQVSFNELRQQIKAWKP